MGLRKPAAFPAFGLLLCGLAFGQATARVPDIQLELRIAGERTHFRIGEAIPIQMCFRSAVPRVYAVKMTRSGPFARVWGLDRVSAEPAAGYGDPISEWYCSHLFRDLKGRGLDIRLASEDPVCIAGYLNEWLRFDAPGSYMVTVQSERVVPWKWWGRRPAAGDMQSAPLSIRIGPFGAEWAETEAARLSRQLDTGTESERADAAMRLGFLGTPAAFQTMASRLSRADGNGKRYILGLVGARDRRAAARAMERVFADPDEPVSTQFVSVLTYLRMRDSMLLRPPPSWESERLTGIAWVFWTGVSLLYVEWFEHRKAEVLRELRAMLPSKTEKARAGCERTLRYFRLPAGGE